MAIVVDIKNIARAADGSVSGNLSLKWDENAFNQDITFLDVSEDFTFPKGGEKQVFDKSLSFGVKVLGQDVAITVKFKAKVFEKDNQVCVQGRVDASAVGLNIGHDLDPNCKPIP